MAEKFIVELENFDTAFELVEQATKCIDDLKTIMWKLSPLLNKRGFVMNKEELPAATDNSSDDLN